MYLTDLRKEEKELEFESSSCHQITCYYKKKDKKKNKQNKKKI